MSAVTARTPVPTAGIAWRVPLSDAIAGMPAGWQPTPGFVGHVGDNAHLVTAVLERTVVIAARSGEPGLVRKAELLVDPAAIRWRPSNARTGILSRRQLRLTAAEREAVRAASYRRTIADQLRHRPGRGRRP